MGKPKTSFLGRCQSNPTREGFNLKESVTANFIWQERQFNEAVKMKNNPLLKMAGFAKGPNRDISKNVDAIYFKA